MRCAVLAAQLITVQMIAVQMIALRMVVPQWRTDARERLARHAVAGMPPLLGTR